jgi:PKD repeat protein
MAKFDLMKHYKLLLIFTFIFGLIACNKQRPVACFVEPSGVLEINEPITFKDCSEFASQYEYTFGDDELSNDPSPEHTYTNEGDFKVTLIVKSDKGKDELIRHLTLVSIPLTNLVTGNYQGTYTETYPIAPDLNNTYTGGCQIYAKNLKEFTVFIPRGGFDTRAIGTNDQLTFTELSNLLPERLSKMKSVSGSFSNASGSLTLTLTGTDPQSNESPWVIRFTGVKG